ncbi:helix-turn-helix domain-containing protein [Cnuibacter physcomitrellae]|uniref:helix-turn-helix domain-containing protein n=1 Tax=Cnuibacter physcomitrellae TaxID=1619308 RepID=UPI00157C1557|nr:helix-turn-helix domain-containing protein [Cnuibacter physcomitrellae]
MSAHDTDEAVETIDQFFPGTTIGSGHGEEFRCDFDTFVSPQGLTFLDYMIAGRPTHGFVESSVGYAFTVAHMKGEMTLGRDTIDSDRPFLLPEGLRGTYDHTTAQAVMISQKTLVDFLDRTAGHTTGGPLRFTGTAPHSEAHDKLWRSTLQTVETAMWGGLVDDPMIAKALSDLVAATVIRCFPNNWQDASGDTHPTTATLRRAIAFVDDHAHEPIAVNDIAAAAGLSERALQEAFRSQLGVTPTAYLRSARLALAREKLLAADPATASVENIARAVGFGHMSRFASAYLSSYGEYPRDTLRR